MNHLGQLAHTLETLQPIDAKAVQELVDRIQIEIKLVFSLVTEAQKNEP